MCLSVPAEIIEINGDRAKVSVGGVFYEAGLDLLDGVEIGDYVLLHSGFAIQVLDRQAAEETLALLREGREKMQ
jgi:hydrogenase expression/formation protein HypC